MKNRHITAIIAATAALSAVSCNSFLDELPDNRTEIDTPEKIQRLLTSAYPQQTYAFYTSLMSDDHDDVGTGYGEISHFETFMVQAWNWEPIVEEVTDTPYRTWEAYYLAIAHSNQALKSIEALGSPSSLNAAKGEALITRAWSHFKLVNLFCQNYSDAHGDTDMGIPYVDVAETNVAQTYERGTVKQVYEKIERDLLAALPLLGSDYSVPKYHFTPAAANAFAAEFYLFQRKYDKVIEYAGAAMGEENSITQKMRDLTAWADDTLLPMKGQSRGRDYTRTDIDANLLLQTVTSQLGAFYQEYSHGKRFMHNTYIYYNESLASPSVLWKTANTTGNMFYMKSVSWSSVPSMCTRQNIPYMFEFTDPVAQIGYSHSVLAAYTIETALLARIEAYIMKEDYDQAMRDINRWVAKRINPDAADNLPKTADQVDNWYGALAYYEYDAPTPKKRMSPEVAFASTRQENFMHALLHMRRIEFFGEGARWFDVKRFNIEIVRRQYRLGDNVTMEDKLAPRDKRMAIQIPAAVIAAGMTPNPR
jgi:hypothetical protein